MGVPVITNNQNYIDIANAIREKTGKDLTYKPTQMAQAIEDMNVVNLSEYVGILPPEIQNVAPLGDSTKIFYGYGYYNTNSYCSDLDTLTTICIYNRITHEITLREQVTNPRTNEQVAGFSASQKLTDLYHFIHISSTYTTSGQNEFYAVNKEDGSYINFKDIEPNYQITNVTVMFSTPDKAVVKINNSKIAILDNNLQLEYIADNTNLSLYPTPNNPYIIEDLSYYVLSYAGLATAIIFKYNNLTEELTYKVYNLPVSVMPAGICDGYLYLISQSDTLKYIYMIDLINETLEPKYPITYAAYNTTSLYSGFTVYDNFICFAYYRNNSNPSTVIMSRDPNLNYIKLGTSTSSCRTVNNQVFIEASQYINGTLTALVIENNEVITKTCNMWVGDTQPSAFAITSYPGLKDKKWYYYCFQSGYNQQQRDIGMGIFVYDADTNTVTQLSTGNDFIYPDYLSSNVSFGSIYAYQLDIDKYYITSVNQYMTPGVAILDITNITCTVYNANSLYYITNIPWYMPSDYFTNTNEHLRPYMTPIRLFTVRHRDQSSNYRLGILTANNFIISELPASNNNIASTTTLNYYYPNPNLELYTGSASAYNMVTQALLLSGTKYLLATSLSGYYCIYNSSNNTAAWYSSTSISGATMINVIGNYHMIKVDSSFENRFTESLIFSQTFENYRKKGNTVYFGYFKCPESYNKHYQAGTSYLFGYNTVTGDIVIPNALKTKQVYLDCMNPTDDDTFILTTDQKLYSYKISTDTLTQLIPDTLWGSNYYYYRHSNGDVYYSTSQQNLLVYKANLGTSTTLISSSYYNYGFLYNGGDHIIGLAYRYSSSYKYLQNIDLNNYTTTNYASYWSNGDITSAVTILKDYLQLSIYSSTYWIIDKKTFQRGSFGNINYIRQLTSTNEERSYLISYNSYYLNKLTFTDNSVTSVKVPLIQTQMSNNRLYNIVIDGNQYKSYSTTLSPTSTASIFNTDLTEILSYNSYYSPDLSRKLEINGYSIVLSTLFDNEILFTLPVTVAMTAGNPNRFTRTYQTSYACKYWCPCSSKGNTYFIWMGED